MDALKTNQEVVHEGWLIKSPPTKLWKAVSPELSLGPVMEDFHRGATSPLSLYLLSAEREGKGPNDFLSPQIEEVLPPPPQTPWQFSSQLSSQFSFHHFLQPSTFFFLFFSLSRHELQFS
jgi:hypothetical protein